MPKSIGTFNKLSEKSSRPEAQLHFIECICTHKIFLPRYEVKRIECYVCKASWKINQRAQFAFGIGENRGIQLGFQRKQ